MKTPYYSIIVIILLLVIIPHLYQSAFADCAVRGWGIGGGTATPMYNPQPQQVEDKQLDVDIRQSQDLFNGDYANTTRSITFRLCDINEDHPIPNVTYQITVTKEDRNTVLDEVFYSNPGLLELQIDNSSTTKVSPDVKQDSKLNSAFVANSNGTVRLQSPFMWEPGAYYLTVKILGYGIKGIIYQNDAPVFNYTTDIPDVLRPEISHGSNTYAIKILSTEKIHNFSYDPADMRISWSSQIPRDYVLKPSHQIFSHIDIPKSFYDFSRSPFLNVTINGIQVPDPYVDTQSSDNDMLTDIPFFGSLLSGHAERQNSTMTTLTFSISPVMKSSSHIDLNHGILALISWLPDPPAANRNSTANIKFFANGTLLENVVYDVYTYHKPGEYLEGKDFLVAKDGTDSENLFLPQNDVYKIQLHVRGLYNSSAPHSVDTALDGDGYGYVVTENGTHPPITAEHVTKIISLNNLKKMIAAQYAHTGNWKNIIHLNSLRWTLDDKDIIIKTDNNFTGPNLWSIRLDGTGLYGIQSNDTVARILQENQSQIGNMTVFVPHSLTPVPAFGIILGTLDGEYQQVLYAADTRTEFPAISHDGRHVIFALEAEGSYDRPLEDGIYVLTPSTPIPEFPLVQIILIISIMSAIVFYRIKIRK